MRVQIKCVPSMPFDTIAWLVQRGGEWILYIADEVLTALRGVLPGCEPVAITPRWRI